MKIFSFLAISAICLFFASCTKNILDYGETEKLSGDGALLKINYVSYYADNRQVYFKINDQRVSGTMTARTPFPGGGYNTGGASSPDFLSVSPGTLQLKVAVPYTIDDGRDSLVLYSTDLQIAAGRKYVAHITDTASNTQTFLTEENFDRPDTATSRYRFVNLMPNVPAIDIYYGTSATIHSADTLIAGNVQYLSTTNSIILKSGQSKTWKIRPAGAEISGETVLAYYTSASSFQNQRVYTGFASGYNGFTTAPRKPYISFFLVR